MLSGLKKFICISILLFSVAACAGKVAGNFPAPPDARLISGVPLFNDTGHQCGPASLAAVLTYWQRKAETLDELTAEEVSADIYSSSAEGTLCIDMETYARGKGFDTGQYSGSAEDLRGNIQKGFPVIILVDLGFSVYQRNHYIVVTGYTDDGIIAHSGAEEIHINYDRLERIWKKTGYWTLLVRPSR